MASKYVDDALDDNGANSYTSLPQTDTSYESSSYTSTTFVNPTSPPNNLPPSSSFTSDSYISDSIPSSSDQPPVQRVGNHGTPIDWNGLFQQMLDRPDDSQEARLKKYEDISTLNDNFVSMAKQLGKIIISEAYLPSEFQTIRPTTIGGVAGGQKYLYNGILFKLQTDWKGIYGSQHNAMKSGSLELKGLMRYYGFHKIHVPLMAVIDYRGCRLVAESLLPIGDETLHYGSSNGGKTVKDGSTCPALQALMKTVASTLKLAGHYCGLDQQNKTFLHGPVDVEGHHGRDGRFYVIDLARVYPPTAESDVAKTFLYRCFRPEFVRKYRIPLSSDGFSKFSRGASDESEHNENLRAATHHLLTAIVPTFALWLESNPQAIDSDHPLTSFTELAHREGINVRYLGLVRSHLKTQQLRSIALMELIARIIKNTLNEHLRKAMAGQPRRADTNYVPIVLRFFNIILGSKYNSDDWWKNEIKQELMQSYKPEILNSEEKQPQYSMRSLVNFSTLFRRVQQLTGVRFTKIVMQQLRTITSMELVSPDIRKMGVRVKHMHITAQAQADALAIQAIASMSSQWEARKVALSMNSSVPVSSLSSHSIFQQPTGIPSNSSFSSGRQQSSYDRLFNLSVMKYEQAIRATPDNRTMLTHYAGILIRVGLLKTALNEPSASFFEKALHKLQIATNVIALRQLGELLQYLKGYWSETDEINELSCRCFEAAVQLDPQHADSYYSWGECLIKVARCTKNPQSYTHAGTKFRKSIQLQPFKFAPWLSNCIGRFTDDELACALELIARPRSRIYNSLYPIIETTPTGEPIFNEIDAQDYKVTVETVSIPLNHHFPSDGSNNYDYYDDPISTSLGHEQIHSDNSHSPNHGSISSATSPNSYNNDHNEDGMILQVSNTLTTCSQEGILRDPLDSSLSIPQTTMISNPPKLDISISSSNLSVVESSMIDARFVTYKKSVTSAILDPIISSFPGISSVKLSNCMILAPTLDPIASTLREINVSGCPDVTDIWIASVVNLPYLNKLDISYCSKLTHQSFKEIVSKCSVLTHLNANHVGGSEQKPDTLPITAFASHQLQSLFLSGYRSNAESWCRLISTSNLNSLRKIQLDECLEVNDTVLAAIGNACPLTHISLRGCYLITVHGLEMLLKGQPRLKSPSISSSHPHSPISTPPPQTFHIPISNINNNSNNTGNNFNITNSAHQNQQTNPQIATLSPGSSSNSIHRSSPIPSDIHHNKSVQYLDLSECRDITFECLDVISKHVTTLKCLFLNNTGLVDLFGGRGFNEFISSDNSALNPEMTQRIDESFQKLVDANPHLCRLELNHANVRDNQFASLASSCGNLKQIKVVAGSITDAGLHSVAKVGLQLELLDLEGSPISNYGLKEFAKFCGSKITALSLNGCTNSDLTEESLVQIAIQCPQITNLDVSHSSCATDISITAVSERCSNLQCLSMAYCSMITDRSIVSLAKNCHKLLYLNISKCSLIVDLGPLGKGCPELRELRANGCEFVSDDTPGFEDLVKLRHLRLIDFCGARYITNHTLALIETNAFPDLMTLILGRNKLSDQAIKSLRAARPHLNIIVSDRTGIANTNNNSSGNTLDVRSSSIGLSQSGSILSASSTEISAAGHNGGPPSTPHAAHIRKSLTLGDTASVAMRTLMHDLKIISQNPTPYVSAYPVDMSEMFVWHGNLLGPEGTPYAGAIFHIELVFPQDYPTNPPSASLFTPMAHPHVYRDHICLDILSDYKGYFSALDELEGNQSKVTSGWNSAYTVQSILLQMQSFLMDLNENSHGADLRDYLVKVPDSILQAKNFSCPKCSHKPGHPWPEITSNAKIVSKTEREIVSEELRCVHTRVSFTEDVLGICVAAAERKNNMTIRYACVLELLSHTAYKSGVRTGAKDGENQFFLPLYLDADHGARAMPLVEEAIAQLYFNAGAAKFNRSMVLEVMPMLMKSLALDLIRSHIQSIHSLQFYFAIHRLFIELVKRHPIVGEKATDIIERFVKGQEFRLKKHVPDLGSILPIMSVVNIPWREISLAYINESLVRNVQWIIRKSPTMAKDTPDEAVDNMRPDTYLYYTKMSMGILMLQVYFLENIGRPRGTTLDEVAAKYDQLYGRLPPRVLEDFLDVLKTIQKTTSWTDIFKFIGLPDVPKPELIKWFRDCVGQSLKNGYHRNFSQSGSEPTPVCRQWEQGHCSRDPCPYLHDTTNSSMQLSASSSSIGNTPHRSQSASLSRTGSSQFSSKHGQSTYSKSSRKGSRKRNSESFSSNSSPFQSNITGSSYLHHQHNNKHPALDILDAGMDVIEWDDPAMDSPVPSLEAPNPLNSSQSMPNTPSRGLSRNVSPVHSTERGNSNASQTPTHKSFSRNNTKNQESSRGSNNSINSTSNNSQKQQHHQQGNQQQNAWNNSQSFIQKTRRDHPAPIQIPSQSYAALSLKEGNIIPAVHPNPALPSSNFALLNNSFAALHIPDDPTPSELGTNKDDLALATSSTLSSKNNSQPNIPIVVLTHSSPAASPGTTQSSTPSNMSSDDDSDRKWQPVAKGRPRGASGSKPGHNGAGGSPSSSSSAHIHSPEAYGYYQKTSIGRGLSKPNYKHGKKRED